MRRRFLHEGCLEPGKPSGLSRGMPKPSSEHADGKILLLCPKPVNAHFGCSWGISSQDQTSPDRMHSARSPGRGTSPQRSVVNSAISRFRFTSKYQFNDLETGAEGKS